MRFSVEAVNFDSSEQKMEESFLNFQVDQLLEQSKHRRKKFNLKKYFSLAQKAEKSEEKEKSAGKRGSNISTKATLYKEQIKDKISHHISNNHNLDLATVIELHKDWIDF